MKLALHLSVALLLPTMASAFTTSQSRSNSRVTRVPILHRSPRLSMAAGDDETSQQQPSTIKSGRKEIAYDEASGRFFETGLDETECIPDEEFCITDKGTGKLIRLTIDEKERIFLDSLQSYYSSGRKVLSDEEFDLLKEDLSWSGSKMVIMNRKEALYLSAVQDYLKGKPTISDKEFDQLKQELMDEGSRFAVQTEPKCYIDTGICKVTFLEDKFRNNLLYLPAATILLVVWLGLGYELVGSLIKLNPVVLTLFGLPFIYKGASFVTEDLVFTNKLVVYGACPNCSYENRVYFGDILGVEGFANTAQCKCPNCKQPFTVQRNTLRASTIVSKN